MWIQVLFTLTFIPAHAWSDATCFSFDTKVIKPLRQISRKNESGRLESDKDVTWATASGTVDKPLAQVLDLLIDHNTTRSPRVDEMEVQNLPAKQYLARHLVKFLIKPFLFVKIRWTEEWGYALAAGSPQNPEEVVISYQKTEGTSHIEHLCGNIVLRKLGDKSTDVFLFEEAKATQRTPEDTLKGLDGTLMTLRK